MERGVFHFDGLKVLPKPPRVDPEHAVGQKCPSIPPVSVTPHNHEVKVKSEVPSVWWRFEKGDDTAEHV